MTTSVAKTVDTLVQSFQEYKSHNDERFETFHEELSQKAARLESMNLAKNRPRTTAHEGDTTMEQTEYKDAFTSYVRRGDEAALQVLEKKNLSTLVDADGGYMVPQTLISKLEKDLSDVSVLRRLANVMQVSSSSVDLLLNTTGAAAGWTGEQDDRNTTDSPQVQKLVVPVHEMYAKPRATQKLLDDASINVEQWLSESVAHRLAALENRAFLYGDGDKKPTGILTFDTAATASWGHFAHVTYEAANLIDNLVDMFAGIKGEYLNDACWLMSRATLAVVRKLKDQDGRHIWQPSLDAATPSTLLGHKVEICDELPALGTEDAHISIIFGNFKRAYQVVDRQGTTVLRDPYSSKPYVEFYTTKRVGGNVVNFESLVMLKSD
jgi:HK97 family phage major capsid protein